MNRVVIGAVRNHEVTFCTLSDTLVKRWNDKAKGKKVWRVAVLWSRRKSLAQE